MTRPLLSLLSIALFACGGPAVTNDEGPMVGLVKVWVQDGDSDLEFSIRQDVEVADADGAMTLFLVEAGCAFDFTEPRNSLYHYSGDPATCDLKASKRNWWGNTEEIGTVEVLTGIGGQDPSSAYAILAGRIVGGRLDGQPCTVVLQGDRPRSAR